MAAVTMQKLTVRSEIVNYFKASVLEKDMDELRLLAVALADSCAGRMSLPELKAWRDYLYK